MSKKFHQKRIKFFTDISHELRTPLTLILAPLEKMVASNLGTAKIRNQLMLMLRNGDRMLQLINQLLDLRKLETGHMQVQVAKGNLYRFVKEVSLAFREMATSRNIDFVLDSTKSKVNVWFDRDKFEIILYNLLSNAFKYTPNGGKIRLSLDVEGAVQNTNGRNEESHLKGFVLIKISNTGRGIKEEQLSHVFERFYTGHGTSKSKRYSSGVGLEIVKNLVDLHKGTIEAQSTYDEKGVDGNTTFLIRLPLGKEHFAKADFAPKFKNSEDITAYTERQPSLELDAEPDQLSIPENEVASVEHDQTILIVEDNDEVRDYVVSIFRSEYNIIEASDGKQGNHLAKEHLPDLIISDIMMPEMDGIELCRLIKSNPLTSHIPVILLTARTAVTFRYEGLETGADDYITKPFSVEELKLRANNLIKQRHRLRERFSQSSSLLPSEITLTSVDEKLMQSVVDFILEHLTDENLTVELIAQEVGLSRANFYRKIKALTDLGAAEFIRMVRIEHAAQLLKTNKVRISEAGSMVGFNDMDYFRKCFKERYGITPTDFARMPAEQ